MTGSRALSSTLCDVSIVGADLELSFPSLKFKTACVSVSGSMYVYYMCALACESQKRASDPLELEFHRIVSYWVGAGK